MTGFAHPDHRASLAHFSIMDAGGILTMLYRGPASDAPGKSVFDLVCTLCDTARPIVEKKTATVPEMVAVARHHARTEHALVDASVGIARPEPIT